MTIVICAGIGIFHEVSIMDVDPVSELGEKKVGELLMGCEVQIRGKTPLKDILRQFKLSLFYSFPVINEKGDFLGMIYKSELLKLIISESFSTDQILQESFVGEIARDFITKVPTVSPEDTISYAASLMYKHKIITVPVVDGKKFLGLITERDIVSEILERI